MPPKLSVSLSFVSIQHFSMLADMLNWKAASVDFGAYTFFPWMPNNVKTTSANILTFLIHKDNIFLINYLLFDPVFVNGTLGFYDTRKSHLVVITTSALETNSIIETRASHGHNTCCDWDCTVYTRFCSKRCSASCIYDWHAWFSIHVKIFLLTLWVMCSFRKRCRTWCHNYCLDPVFSTS